ncbi:MAG: hypothetical protein H0W71_01740 [Sphingomonas sp.]|nr:hypothetical protein [Sphingomonas sp.]
MTDPALSDAGRVKIYVVSDYDNIDRFLGIANVRGMYVPQTSGLIAFVPKMSRDKGEIFFELNSQIIFFHEYAHHLQLQNTSAVIPRWLVEGTAEFFSTAGIEKDGSIRFGAPANHRASTLLSGHNLPFKTMLEDNYSKLNDEQSDDLYGRGWLLTHYLTFEPTRRGQLDTYLKALQKGQPALAAAQAAFGNIDQLERDLDAYVKRRRLTTLVVPRPAAGAGAIAIRQMQPGEAANMTVRARSNRGVNTKTAPGVAAEARKIAGQYPNDPAVMTAHAEAERDANQYAAAIAASTKAIALDPTNNKALIFKARALKEDAEARKAKVNWTDIRALLIKANRLDPDDPEPLMYYYLSYPEAGDNPSRNAVTGLIYAADLVPQVDELRFLATQQLLFDKDLPRALQMYAYDPHQSERSREQARRVMAAIAAGNSRQALDLLGNSGDDDSGEATEPPRR